MTEIPNGSFFMPADKPGSTNTSTGTKANTKTEKEPKKEVVYVSKTPEAAVNAAGVVAGTSGMVGGAVFGGVVGASRLPGEYAKQVATLNYSKVVKEAIADFKEAIKVSPELGAFAKAIQESKSPAAAEEIMEIAKTISQRLHTAFASDPNAAAVINKVVDPFIDGISVRKNFTNYRGAVGKFNKFVKSPLWQTILKIVGGRKKTSKIVGDIAKNMAEGITQAVENIRAFTPEEQAAWKKVAKQITEEFEHNSKIKLSTGLAKAIRGMTKSTDWITNPLKSLQETVVKASKELNKGLTKAPLKTIGPFSLAGAAICATLSTLGWFGFKKALMKKEVAKAEAAAAA